jgi:hypothetical protein
MNSAAPLGNGVSVDANSSSTPRIRRRIRFRTTAPPTRLGIAKATRSPESSGRASRNRTRRSRERTWIPEDRSSVNVACSEIPRIKQTACDGPYGGDSSQSPDRRGSTSASGNRVSWLACEHLVDTCASSLLRTSGALVSVQTPGALHLGRSRWGPHAILRRGRTNTPR